MKFDCYQRFLKSDLYKECVILELQGKSLPYENQIDNKSNNYEYKPELSVTQVLRNKKKSLIPWPKRKTYKTQAKNTQKEMCAKQPIIRKLSDSLSKMRSTSKTLDDQMSTTSADRSDLTASQSSITSSKQIDQINAAFALSKSIESINESNFNFNQISGHCNRDNCRLSRVILPDRSQTVVSLTNGEKIGQTLQKLLDKRKLKYSAFDAFVTGCEKVYIYLSIYFLSNYSKTSLS